MAPELVTLHCSFAGVTGVKHSALPQLMVQKLTLYVVINPQRQDHVWSRPFTMHFLQLRTAGLLSL